MITAITATTLITATITTVLITATTATIPITVIITTVLTTATAVIIPITVIIITVLIIIAIPAMEARLVAARELMSTGRVLSIPTGTGTIPGRVPIRRQTEMLIPPPEAEISMKVVAAVEAGARAVVM
ncbi:MAG: hypothetical protein HZB98_04130 [Bacteroidia bacterium]|nr:hypothetical protein [Bacteroidia bacterium]